MTHPTPTYPAKASRSRRKDAVRSCGLRLPRSVRSPADAAALFPAEALAGPGEKMLLALLDQDGGVLGDEWIAAGAGGSLAYDPSLVARRLAEMGAAWFLLVHNHPGGNPTLSETDAAGVRTSLLRPPPLLFRFLDFLAVAPPERPGVAPRFESFRHGPAGRDLAFARAAFYGEGRPRAAGRRKRLPAMASR